MKKKFLVVLLAIVSTLAIAFGLSACNLLKVEHKLSFVVDGEVYATINTNGEEVISMPEDPVKEDYIFDGWYWDNDVWSRPFTANSLLNEKLTSNMSVYAKWIEETVVENQYTLTFNSMGGSTVDAQTIKYGQTASEPTKPTKAGYIFVGWYKEADFTNKWDFATDTITGDITLYAKWVDETDAAGSEIISANGFTINDSVLSIKVANVQNNFALSEAITVSPYATWTVTTDIEGKNEIPSATVSLSEGNNTYYINVVSGNGSNKKQYTVNIRRREIYSVTYRLNNGDTDITEQLEEDSTLENKNVTKTGYSFVEWQYGDNAWNFENTISENMTLVADWSANTYKVTFNSNQGSAVEDACVTYDAEFVLTVPQENGYTFNGWKTESGIMLTDEDGKGLSVWNIAEDTTVYADWSVNEYTITYNLNGGINDEINPVKYTVEDNNITLAVATKAGYTFKGWYSDAELTEAVSQIDVSQTKNIELYAKWEVITYTATFVIKGATVERIPFTVETVSIEEPDITPENGYTAVWSEYELIADNLTITAIYTPIEYSITYENTKDAENGNVASYTIESEAITIADVSVNGYTFDGWYNGEDKVTEIAKGSYGNLTLAAKWTVNEYTITYENVKGAENGNVISYTIESEAITLEDISVNGYTFDGWYNGEVKVTDISTGSYGNLTFVAKWTPTVYTITFANTKDVENGNATSYTIESETIRLADISVNGYTFDGWYNGEVKVTEISAGSYGDIILTAKWIADTYTITYIYDADIGDYAEGMSNPASYTIEDEFEFVDLVNKTEGYISYGWYTEKNNGSGIKVSGISRGTTGNITIYAQWGLEVYSITYNNVEGVINTNATSYTVESETFTIESVSQTGYTFNGWFADEECTTPASLTITKGSNGNITLYAKWTPITYTIEYVTYGGTATGNPATYLVTDDITFNNATLSGYVFKGWYTAAEGGSKVSGISAGTTGNIILYAHWDYVSTITFESNGGSLVDAISNVEGTAISAPVAPTKEHYTFAGWYSDSTLTEVYTFTTQPAEDITLYAKWSPVIYEIEYVLNGGLNSEYNVTEYTVEDKIELYAPSKVGYTFIGWFTNSEFTSVVVTELPIGTSGKITLYAHYSINQYTISFESNGGTSVASITQNYATSVNAPEAPAKNGYSFAGWYSNESLTKLYTFSTMPAENITLYAKWNLVTYNIIYNLNGGTNSDANPANYTILSATITLNDATKTGYSFVGWYTDAECTVEITDIASGSYGDVELFAKWTAIEYDITYVTADGATHSNITTYTIETDLTVLAEATLKGHTFGGWYTDDSYITAVTNVAGGEIGNKTIYAQFTANTYNVWLDGNEEASCIVSFNLNGAEGTIESQTVTPTVTLEYPTTPTRDGYIFAGWYANEDCTGSLYDFTVIVTSDTTLYAKWVKVENATAISINGSSDITFNGKVEQMLMFVPLVSGNITITASGSYDTFGVLYNSEMTALVQNDDGASDGINFHIVHNVTAGEIYYIGARAFSSTAIGTATISISGNNTVADGGYTVTTTKTTVTYGQSFAFAVPDARDGYKFLGYKDAEGVMYTDETGASIKTWDKDSETTLYSVWERTVYTVTFVTNGGTEIDPITLAYGDRFDISQYTTTRTGYTFNGWYLDGVEYNATTMPDHSITLTAYWKTFALGSIKYDIDKTAISVNDEITAELFSAICLDTDGNLATFNVTVSGTQEAGNTITVRLTATSGGKNKVVTITDIKVYGMPTLTFDNTVDYVNINGGITSLHFGASGTDSFGTATKINVYINGEYEAGDLVTIVIESDDPVGNITYGYIDNVKAYGLPEIRYNTNKNVISVSDTLNAELFGATAKDSFGENLAVTVTKYSGTIAAGNTVTIRISATDSKGNTTNIDVTCKVYGNPTISNAAATDVKVSDTITTELLGITANDTYGEALTVALSVKDGSQSAGTSMIITATVTDIAGNVITKDYTLKVYGKPTISYDKEALKVSEDAVQSPSSVLNASAKDSFGKSLTVAATLNGTFEAGKNVTYTLTTTDHLGNTYSMETSPIGVYDVGDIRFNYDSYAGRTDIIKLTSKGEEFDAQATDSFGDACTISIEAAEGYTLAGGNIVSLYIVATDKAGNKSYSELITGIKVYDIPTAIFNIYEDSDINFAVVVKDSFEEELYAEISLDGELIVGNIIYVTVKAEDDAYNVLDKTYECIVQRKGHTYTEKEDGTYELTSYVGTNETVEILSSYAGKAVVSIADNAFENQTSVKEIIMPETIVSIGDSAFYACINLTSITIPDSVTSIGTNAFYNCYKLIEVKNLSSLSIIAGSSNNGYVGYYAKNVYTSSTGKSYLLTDENGYLIYNDGANKILLGYTGNQTDLTIPSSISQIYQYAFYRNKSLTSVNIGSGVTSIGKYAFYDCDNLTSITIGNSVTNIGNYAFYNCSSLTEINYNARECDDLSSSNYVFAYAGQDGTGITVKNGANVKIIPAYLFYPYNDSSYSPKITSVIFEEGSVCESISSYAFYNCSSLTSITIPDSVISFGYGVFYSCSDLTNVIIGNSVTSIGANAFYNCYKLIEVKNLSSLSITAGSSNNGYVGYYAKNVYTSSTGKSYLLTDENGYLIYNDGANKILLGYTGNQTDLTIPSSISQIYQYAFYRNKSLTSVNIGSGATSIGKYAFYDCDNLTSITIGNSVTNIGNYAFSNCSALTEINYNATECADLVSGNNVFYNAGQSGTGIEVTIGSNVKKIPAYLFYSNSSYVPNITSVAFEEGSVCESIGSYAFYNCSSLTSVTIPDSVTSIGEYAFYNCSSLIEINYNATECADLSSSNYVFNKVGQSGDGITVTIGANVKRIPAYLFCPAYYDSSYAPKIISVVFEEGSVCERIGSTAFKYCSSLTSITIPDSVTNIGSSAFQYGGLTTVNWNATACTSVEGSSFDAIFSGCAKLTIVIIGENVETIPSYAFYGCGGLTTVRIPDSVTSIGSYAFFGCDNLMSVTIGNSVASIGDNAFSNCYKLVEVYDLSPYLNITKSTNNGYIGYQAKDIYSSLSEPSKLSMDENGYILYTDGADKVLMGYSGTETKLVLPSGITQIYKYAFNYSSLTSVTIPNSVTSIGVRAFEWCMSLTSITIPDSVTSIGGGAFGYCYDLTSVTLGNSVTSIGEFAFEYCSGLTSITVATGNKVYHSAGNCLIKTESKVLILGCKKSVIPSDGSVTSIGSCAFYGCGSLTSVTIPSSVTSIGRSAFRGCSGLTSVTIGNSVTSIGSSAFYECSKLTSVTIPSSVTSIGSYAFYGCRSLTSVTFKKTSGWVAGSTSISSTDLANTSTAATYLRSTYYYYNWKRS